jgi:hypothetical protein
MSAARDRDRFPSRDAPLLQVVLVPDDLAQRAGRDGIRPPVMSMSTA